MRRLAWCLPLCCIFSCSLTQENPSHLDSPPSLPSVSRKPEVSAPLPSVDLESLARTDPVGVFEHSLARYRREVHGYQATLQKQERLRGRLGVREVLTVWFREEPFSVRMEWKEGGHLARRALFVAGANSNQILVLPAGWRALAGIVPCDLDDPAAKSNSRYPITEFGIRKGTERALASWKAAKKRGDLRVRCDGVQKPKELNQRPCVSLTRTEKPGDDPEGIIRSTFYFDLETALQVGTILEDGEGRLIASYFFRDVKLNPVFPAELFRREGLRRN